MLRGIDANPIIVGGYTDGDGGVCPMLAAHRNGGRTSFASFADAWDDFTGAGRRPRRASRRELGALRTYLKLSLLEDDTQVGGDGTLVAAARQIRAERDEWARAAEHRPSPDRPGDRNRTRELRDSSRWSWLSPTRSYDVIEATVAAAQEQDEELLARR